MRGKFSMPSFSSSSSSSSLTATHINSRSNTRSPILLFSLSLLILSLFFIIVFYSPSHPDPSVFQPSTVSRFPHPQTSFIASLDHFLTHRAPKSLPLRDDTVVDDEREEAVKKLDEAISERETVRLVGDLGDPYYPVRSPIRVYVYDMPWKFTYDLLWMFRNTYRETSNLTSNGSPVHRLIEQHSIDYWLWADLMAPESERLLKNVVRVNRQEEADLFYVPFFTTISFFLLEKQQCKALYRVKL